MKHAVFRRIFSEIGVCCIVLAVMLFWGEPSESSQSIHHDLRVKIVPPEHRIVGFDRIGVSMDDAGPLRFAINGSSIVKQVLLEGEKASFEFRKGVIVIPIGDSDKRLLTVEIDYEARFNDPYPESPVSTDNPGYGVTGIVSRNGVFLLSGAGWYPEIPGSSPKFSVVIETPEDMIPVTSGKLAEVVDGDGVKSFRWEVNHPVRGLSVSAASYAVDRIEQNGVEISTYFMAQPPGLSRIYLDASTRYLKFYEGLFGRYPFEKFSVVENFFPTGYGFASYTLIGGTVLRLPFIPVTSLPHEIAHCWWGNSVWVDSSGGNWSEGLTTYVADYLLKEQSSPESAMDYRQQMIRNYTALVPKEMDFPLAQFISRIDPVSRAIGYDKSAMVFHMVRKLLGDAVFWDSLRDIYETGRFQEISWNDLRLAFERKSGKDLSFFFRQWVGRQGAPEFSLDAVAVERQDQGWSVSGIIKQESPIFELSVPVLLKTREKDLGKSVFLNQTRTPFTFFSSEQPIEIVADPGFDILRRLHPLEVPPSVNSLKSVSALTIILGEEDELNLQGLAEILVQSLGVNHYKIVDEKDFSETASDETGWLFLGMPRNKAWINCLSKDFKILSGNFSFQDTQYGATTHAFLGVFKPPGSLSGVAAVFLPGSVSDRQTVARKISHYGKYGYLMFKDGQNITKGVWPVSHSPVRRLIEKPS